MLVEQLWLEVCATLGVTLEQPAAAHQLLAVLCRAGQQICKGRIFPTLSKARTRWKIWSNQSVWINPGKRFFFQWFLWKRKEQAESKEMPEGWVVDTEG